MMLYPADQSKIRTAVLWAEPILNPSERERILNPKVTMDLEDHFDGGSDHGDYKFCDFHSSPAPNHLFFLKHFHPSIIQSHCFKLRLICEVFWMAPPLLSGGGGGTDSLIHWKHENLQPANFKDYSHSRHHSKFPAQSAGWSHSSKSCSQQKHNLQSESQTLGWSN